MRIACIGGGPAGLYFAILMKKADPSHDIEVLERNPRGVTFGWGVVFSDETLGYLQENDAPSWRDITARFAHWDQIDTYFKGEHVRSGGHGFSGIARRRLLGVLEERAESLGVRLRFGTEVEDDRELADRDLVIAADGVRSRVRERLRDAFRPTLEEGRCRYIWLGTHRRFDAFTFLFEETAHGWFTVHAYRFDEDTSTFIVECHEDTWRAAGLDRMPVEDGVRWLERLFARHLDGEPLLTNHSSWIRFPTVANASWHHGNVVLMGDAAHTAHFSIGSGTKLAMEDAIALARAFQRSADVKTALAEYETERLAAVGRLQKAARESRTWFENVARYAHFEPTQFVFSLLTRSRRVSFDNLAVRDPAFAGRVKRWFVARSCADPSLDDGRDEPTPPMFTPFRLRGMTVANRVVVSPMCMYSADDGLPGDYHLVHLGSRAVGGAGLVLTEMTCVAPEARITPGCAGMYRPEHREAWRRIVEFVHAHSRARIGIQLGHAGRKGSTRRIWEGTDVPLGADGWPIVAPSPVPFRDGGVVPREMDRADMDGVVARFVAAARDSAAAGFDLLELHMAHGYLLSSFLTPLANRRRDDYGGALANRMRFPLEVLDAVRAAWPAERPLSVRISATDWVEGGFDVADAVELARALAAHGADVIDVSAGQTTPDAKPVYGRAFQTPFSDRVRNEARVPTIAVGNITTPDEVNSILAAGRADLVALARPHLADPYWTLHAAAAVGHERIEWPVQYQAGRPRPPRP